jgi:hypothetical protein
VNDLKSMGFLDNLSYESKERTGYWRSVGHIAVYSNYARDLLYTRMRKALLKELCCISKIGLYVLMFIFHVEIRNVN